MTGNKRTIQEDLITRITLFYHSCTVNLYLAFCMFLFLIPWIQTMNKQKQYLTETVLSEIGADY